MFAPRGWLSRPVARRIYLTVQASPLFDRHWYRRHNMSGLSRMGDPLWHFLKHGQRKALDPSEQFDSGYYLHAYPDVQGSQLNPLFHYLEYGPAERRHPLRSVLRTMEWLFPDAAELPVFGVPRAGGPRVTLVVDSATLARVDTSLNIVVDSAIAFAASNSASLRIISLLPSSGLVIDAAQGKTQVDIAVVSSPAHTPHTHYDTVVGEFFVAASWTAAAAIRHAAAPRYLWCFPPVAGTKVLSADETPLLKVTAHSESLWRSWSLTGHIPAAPAATGEPSPASRFPAGSPLHLCLKADPVTHPAAYFWALREIENLVLETPGLESRLRVTIVGSGVRPVRFLEALIPTILETTPMGFLSGVDAIVDATKNPAKSPPDTPIVIAGSPETLSSPGLLAQAIRDALDLGANAHV